MAYQELIKNFERIREYMRQFYVYGWKSREAYEWKSVRSYDNEKRRIESYLKDQMAFSQDHDGKRVFISMDSREIIHNPMYQAWKAKSCTDRDITLHFYVLDMLQPGVQLSIGEILSQVDEYLSVFQEPMSFDVSTLRKKLKEYTSLGLIKEIKQGKQLVYERETDIDLKPLQDAICFFSEASMLGIIGSYVWDHMNQPMSYFTLKHHYLTPVLESDILLTLFTAIQEKQKVLLVHAGRKSSHDQQFLCVPLKIFVSVQQGRQYLIAYHIRLQNLKAFRLDYIKQVKPQGVELAQEQMMMQLHTCMPHMWGVRCNLHQKRLETVSITITFEVWEGYIYQRMCREKRIGKVTLLAQGVANFYAEVYDTMELIPWIRTFLGRIVELRFSHRALEHQFWKDVDEMLSQYEEGSGEDAVS